MENTFPRKLLRVLLHLYPSEVRRVQGREMEQLYREMWDRSHPGAAFGPWAFRFRMARDLLGNLPGVWNLSRRGRGTGDHPPSGSGSGSSSEFRFALRRLLRSPGFAVVAVLTLGLGVAANASMFALINGIYLTPLPFHQPDELVYLREANERMRLATSYDAFQYFQAETESFQGLASFTNTGVTLEEGEDPVRLAASAVSANLFEVLGVEPLMGRRFLPSEEDVGSEAVVMLGYGTWQGIFGGDPDIVGKTLRFSTGVHTVIGVMPEDFRFPLQNVQCWISLRRLVREPNYRALTMVARLKDGWSQDQAGQEAQAVGDRLEEANPPAKGGDRTLIFPLQDYVVGSRYTASFSALFVAVGFLFLIACANLTNLLMARARARARELAVRQALGASRWRIALASIAEPLLLSVVSGGVGILGASWAIGLLKTAGPADIPRLADIVVDGWVMLFALGLSVVAGFLIGLTSQPKAAARRSPGDLLSGGRVAKGRRLQSGFTVVQVALTFALLAGVGLMSKTVRNLQMVDPGFESEGALVVGIRLSQARYPDPEAGVAFLNQVEERLAGLPGVTSVGYSTTLPLGDGWSDRTIRVEGDSRPVEELPVIEFDGVSPGFVPAMGISLLQGRLLDEGDRMGTPGVAVINQTAARALFPDAAALGRRFSGPAADGTDWITVVGVVEDVLHHNLVTPATPKYYTPFAQNEWTRSWIPSLVVRYQGREPGAMGSTVRSLIKELDGGNPLVQTTPLGSRVDRFLEGPRLNAFVLSGFTLAALLLAALGLYAILAFGVAERRKEIGIRMALGAGRGKVRLETLRGGMGLTLMGIVIGLPLALGLGRVMESLLFGVGSYDAPILGQVTLLLGGVAILACVIPSSKASRVNPMESLREE